MRQKTLKIKYLKELNSQKEMLIMMVVLDFYKLAYYKLFYNLQKSTILKK